MIDATERALLRATVDDAVAEARPAGSDALDRALHDLGWLDMLAGEPDDAIDIVFSALGATNSTATVLDDVLTGALGREPRAEVAVVLPPFAAWTAPGRIEGGHLAVVGLATARAATAHELLVVGHDDSGWTATTVPTTAADISVVQGIDPDARMHLVHVRDHAASARSLEPTAWDTAVALGRRAVGHQLVGASRAMLELARTHALERVQFGRPIAKFQAVRHRLAESLVAIEAAEAALAAAADERGPTTAALAKALAGRAARTVAGHCQQVLAGIGFTTDHDFHEFLKRSMLLEGLFGSSDAIVLAVGHQLLADRTVPTLVEL